MLWIAALLAAVGVWGQSGAALKKPASALASQSQSTNTFDTTLLPGVWLEPIPGREQERQGFQLNADGSASSIGMATWKVSQWRTKGDVLILEVQSIGNRQTLALQERYIIREVRSDSLVLDPLPRRQGQTLRSLARG